jgi:hypothetical protein
MHLNAAPDCSFVLEFQGSKEERCNTRRISDVSDSTKINLSTNGSLVSPAKSSNKPQRTSMEKSSQPLKKRKSYHLVSFDKTPETESNSQFHEPNHINDPRYRVKCTEKGAACILTF